MAAKKVQLQLTETERGLLTIIAKSNGYSDFHRWLHHEIHGLEKRLKRPVALCERTDKEPKSMKVSDDALKFISKLSTCHSKEISTTILRFIVYPAIKDYMLNENTKGLLKEARDQLVMFTLIDKSGQANEMVNKIDNGMGW